MRGACFALSSIARALPQKKWRLRTKKARQQLPAWLSLVVMLLGVKTLVLKLLY
jgi:hypothetical protein